MRLRAFPGKFGDQMGVRHGRRDADVVHQAKVEEARRFGRTQAHLPRALRSHDADAFSVREVVDADQVERVGQRVDDAAKIGAQRALFQVVMHAAKDSTQSRGEREEREGRKEMQGTTSLCDETARNSAHNITSA